MKGKKRNKFLAGFLAFVMVFLMLPVVPFAPVEAAIAEDADVIRLPITVRDANEDRVLFYESYNEAWEKNCTNWVTHELNTVNGTPIYSDTAIKAVAARINSRNRINNTSYVTNNNLKNALLKAYDANSSTWESGTASNYVKVTYLEDAKTAYAAAEWLLSHLFLDGKYSNAEADEEKEYDPSRYYTQTYKGYETLVLRPGTYGTGTNAVDCYYYDSLNESSMFNYTSADTTDEIYNDSNGTKPSAGGWFPIDGLGFAQIFNNRNFHHTTAGNGQFVYHKDDKLFFAFTGDDDVYLYINGKLVIDAGGIHDKDNSEVYLENRAGTGTRVVNVGSTSETWAEYLELEEGGIYRFDFFQMERNLTESNFSIYTNINVVDSSAVPQKKVYQNGQELIYGSFVPQGSDVTYGFELTNNGGTNDTAVTNLTFKDDLLGVTLTKDTIELNGNEITDLEYDIIGDDINGYRKLSSVDQLKELLAAGIGVGKTFSIRGFKYNVGMPATGETTKTIVNTVQTTATGTANNSGQPKVIKGSATTRVRTWNIKNKAFVIDYAKPVLLTNDALFGTDEANELVKLSGVNHVEEKDETEGNIVTDVTLNDTVDQVTLDKTNGEYGTMSLAGTPADVTSYNLTYTPTKVMNGVDSFIVKIKVDTETTITKGDVTKEYVGSNTINKNISMVPASNVYYEDAFVTDESTGTVGIQYGTGWTVEYSNESPGSNTETVNGSIHGWVDSLSNDNKFTDGSAHKLENGAVAVFTFKGTGADIYSYTDIESGMVTARLTKLDDTTGTTISTQYFMVDNLAVSNGTNGYYHIPTLSFQGLDYGTYRVNLIVNRAKAVQLDEDGNPVVDANGDLVYSTSEYRSTYYLDGIRVYNPLGPVVDGTAADAYENTTGVVGEKIRTEYVAMNTLFKDDKVAVFTDLTEDGRPAVAEMTATDTYKTYGPKNEVYLAKGQSVVFAVDSDMTNYYVGLKSLKGDAVPVNAAFTNGEGKDVTAISHSADIYYKVVPTEDGYITITNTSESGDAILAITKLQMVGPETAKFALRPVSDEEAVSYVTTFATLKGSAYNPEPVEPEDTVQPEAPEVEIPKPDRPGVKVPSSMLDLFVFVNRLFNSLNKWFGRS